LSSLHFRWCFLMNRSSDLFSGFASLWMKGIA
jgi:hypothetical protein